MQVFKAIGSYLLNWIAIILFVIVHPFNSIAEILKNKNSSDEAFKNALAIDIFGNEHYKTFWNWAFRKKGGYNFGVKGETISVAIAKNMRQQTLSWFGWFCAVFIVIGDPTTWGKGGHFKGIADKPRLSK
jgi:hypothetical protein